jgi:hypothetical protein
VSQVVGLGCIIAWTLLFMLPLFVVLDRYGLMRVGADEERRGLDFYQHGGVTQLEANRQQGQQNERAYKKVILITCQTFSLTLNITLFVYMCRLKWLFLNIKMKASSI